MPNPGLKQTFYGRWEMGFKSGDLPPGPHEIAAWVFDFQRQTVARMAGAYRVDGDKMSVERIGEKEDPAGKN